MVRVRRLGPGGRVLMGWSGCQANDTDLSAGVVKDPPVPRRSNKPFLSLSPVDGKSSAAVRMGSTAWPARELKGVTPI